MATLGRADEQRDGVNEMKMFVFVILFAAVVVTVNILHNPGLLRNIKVPDVASSHRETSGGESSKEISTLAARCARSLLIIEGDEGAGSGSIINFKGNPLIVTNVHVLSGNANPRFKLLNAREVTPETFGIPDDRDICVATQRQVGEGLEASTSVNSEVAIGDAVIVMGNSQGSHVATEIKGKVVGIGPDLIETDAKFVKGNSGSPIIHVKTGKVIAIATFATVRRLDDLSQDSQFKQIRRFGYRIDTVPQWKFLNPKAFAAESQQIGEIKQRTDDLFALAVEILKRGTVTASEYNPKSWVGSTLGISHGTLENQVDLVRYGRAGGELRHSLNDDLTYLVPEKMLPYHQRELADEFKSRGMLAKFFGKLNWTEVKLRK